MSAANDTAERCRYEGSCEVATPYRREADDQRSAVELMAAISEISPPKGSFTHEQAWALAREGRASWEAIQRGLNAQLSHTRACLAGEIEHGPPGACAFKEFMDELVGELELLILVAHVHANPVILH